ncbi:MAG: hypothetical protein IIC39_09320, partial [Candidatus Marinimicrobia bacterium]|nr:hypothetical protein [Candidatus Neomarinimicrobiota bacterium]
VSQGEKLVSVYSDSKEKLESQLDEIKSAFVIGDEKPQIPELVKEVI